MIKQEFAFNFDFFFIFIFRWKASFLIMELIVSFPYDTKVSSSQLKRFSESVIDPKCLQKVEVTSFSFDNNLSFWRNIFSCTLLFLLEKYGLHAFQNGLEL